MFLCVYLGVEAGLLEISPAYYPQTTLLPTHLYFTVGLLVVHSSPVLLGWKNVLQTRMNHVIFVALIFQVLQYQASLNLRPT